MKRLVLSAMAAAALVLSAAAVQAQDSQSKDRSAKSEPAGAQLQGTVSRIDQSGEFFVLRDQSGQDVTVYWTTSTRLQGPESNEGRSTNRSGEMSSSMTGLKVGDEVTVTSQKQGDKTVASSVVVKPRNQ